jgi:putative redox protein
MYHLRATNEDGRSVDIDAAPAIGGGNKGMRPMQLMLASAGSCSSIDIISILKKQKQNLRDIVVEVNGEREKDKTPSLFTDINLHFILYGDLDPDKAKRAVDLSVMKYCSALKTLEKTAHITYTFEIQP